jgi:hypothetical protein
MRQSRSNHSTVPRLTAFSWNSPPPESGWHVAKPEGSAATYRLGLAVGAGSRGAYLITAKQNRAWETIATVGSWKIRRSHAGEVPFMHGTDGRSLYII